MSLKQTQVHKSQKHIYFCYIEKDEFDSTIATKLKANFDKRRFRIYYPRENEDINMKIATGIENAAVVLVFPSFSLQISKAASKLLNYADQTKTPIINIRHHENFQAKGWLGTVLASGTDCSTDFNHILECLNNLKVNIFDLVLERNENNEPQEMQKQLFYGGTKMGNVFATFQQFGQQFPMKLQFLGLDQGKIFGQGHDDVGRFTLAGKYRVENGSGKFKMYKQYIEKHLVKYRGKILFQDQFCMMKGKWKIDNDRDEFSIELILPEAYKTDETEQLTLIPKILRSQGSKVMLSYCPNQYDLSQKIMKGLISKGIEIICPPIDMNEMIKIATVQARVIVPLMSEAYEASTSAKYVLSYADEIGIPIVPIKAQVPYSASGWLGVICAGSLWTQITKSEDIEEKLDQLVGQLRPYMQNLSNQEQQTDTVADENLAQGYYIQYGERVDMTFEMFTMVNGYIAGRGEDIVGQFVISGEYSNLLNSEDFQFQFKKRYIGQHTVEYKGTTTHNESQIFLDGNWSIDTSSDRFHLEVSQNKSSKFKTLHIMLSYQWNNQKLVKRVADMLKQNQIPIWFDIAGDMKGNINTAMAQGVEDAAMIVSFNTVAYSKSVNCQKELTYASQLKKTIVPVLLEDHTNFEGTWLGRTISSLNKISMKDEKQFNTNYNMLKKCIYEALQANENQKSDEVQIVTRFEGGAVRGQYRQYDKDFDMYFDFLSLRRGRVTGQGNDKVGHFILVGNYDNDGNVKFTKQYIEKHAVEYEGHLDFDDMGKFKIKGKWRIEDVTDDFYIESVDASN